MDSVTLTPELLDKIVEILVREAQPEKIILFGSHARGDAGPDSDIDLLVIENEVTSEFRETVRLQQALRQLRVPVEIHVADRAKLRSSWADFPGYYLYDALREGREVYALDGAGTSSAA